MDNELPKPIFDSIPSSEKEKKTEPSQADEPTLQAEEISSDIADTNASFSPPPDIPIDIPPPIYQSDRSKFIIIAIVVLFFIAILSITLYFVFRGAGPKPDPKVTLEYWGLWEDATIMEPLIEEYHKAHPNVTIKYAKMDPNEYLSKLIARTKNNTGPDIFRFHNTWLPQLSQGEVPAYVPSNIMTIEEFTSTFYPVIKSDLTIDDKIYGIPLTFDALVLVYNDGLFRSRGLTGPPKDIIQLTDYVNSISIKSADGRLITSGLAIGRSDNVEHFSDAFGYYLLINDVDLSTLDSEYGEQSLQAFRKFAEEPTDYWNGSMPNSITAFVQQQVAMLIVPSWWVNNLKVANKDLEIKTAVLPGLTVNSTPTSLASYWAEGVSRTSSPDEQRAAWQFLKHMAQKEQLQKLFELQSKTRTVGSASPRIDMADTVSQNPYLAPLMTVAPNAKSMPLNGRTYDTGLNKQIVDYIGTAIDATTPKPGTAAISYREALQTAQKGITSELKRYGIIK